MEYIASEMKLRSTFTCC